MKLFRGRQQGFTLVELLVAIPIGALVLGAATGLIIHMMKASEISADTLAIRQVQTAGDWVSYDGVQAQRSSGIGTVDSGFPFTLMWSYWDTGASPPVNETHTVTYSLTDMPSGSLKKLERHEIVTDAFGAVVKETTMTVAEYVDDSATTCRWEADAASPTGYSQTSFIFSVTVTVGEKTQVRTYQIRPRAML